MATDEEFAGFTAPVERKEGLGRSRSSELRGLAWKKLPMSSLMLVEVVRLPWRRVRSPTSDEGSSTRERKSWSSRATNVSSLRSLPA
jgi:hypothetical protein